MFRWLLPVIALLSFVLTLFHTYRFGRRDYPFFVVAPLYAMLMEWAQRLYLEYYYIDAGPHLLDVPLVIPFGWAAIFYVADQAVEWLWRGKDPFPWRSLVGGLITMVIIVPLEVVGISWDWWLWGVIPQTHGVPWLVPFLPFGAGFSFLLGYHMADPMERRWSRLLTWGISLAVLLFLHTRYLLIVQSYLLRLA
ncbi:MAG: hypothetical protein ACE5NP_07555 [Anaerolineae bacterium]